MLWTGILIIPIIGHLVKLLKKINTDKLKEASFYHVCNLFDDAVFIDVNSCESYDRVI